MDATKRSTQTVIVSGKGNKKNEAFASALNDVSKKVLKETTEVLIRIEPKEVTIRQAKEQVYTEKFLFFFFPRKRVIYHVELAVEVEIQAIAVEEVDFLTETIKEPNAVVRRNGICNHFAEVIAYWWFTRFCSWRRRCSDVSCTTNARVRGI